MARKHKNLLLIWTDQQRNDTLPCHGNDYVQAPNLKQLGEESFVFRKAYCTQPVCTPSRGSIMTGLWPHAHGCVTNNLRLAEDKKTIAEMVPEDYHCAYYGKWHLGDELDAQHGFDDWISIEDGIYRKYYSNPESLKRRSDYHYFLEKNGFPTDENAFDGAEVYSRVFAAGLGENFTKASFLANEAARFIGEQSEDKPFILSVNFLEPHPPTFGPLNDLYDPETLPVTDAFMEEPADNVSDRTKADVQKFKDEGYKRHPLGTEWGWRRVRANYYGLVTLVDRAVGKILNALEASGLAEDTVVIYTSDHGEFIGDHLLWQKGLMYEESSRIPLMIRAPWLSKEHVMIDGPVSQIDLVPTALDLMGVEVPDHLQGKSRLGVLKGEEDMGNEDVFIEWNKPSEPAFEGRAVVTADGWKLTLYHDDIAELYDMNTDPCELKNIYTDPAHNSRIAEMTGRIKKWQQEVGDTLTLKS